MKLFIKLTIIISKTPLAKNASQCIIEKDIVYEDYCNKIQYHFYINVYLFI